MPKHILLFIYWILDVANFLMKTGSVHSWHPHAMTFQTFLEKSSECFFGYIYLLDWRKSSTEDMVSLRENKLAWNLLIEVILKNMSLNQGRSYLHLQHSEYFNNPSTVFLT